MCDKEKCMCELYYSDSAIRERCLAVLATNAMAPDYTDPLLYNAERLFEYIKNGKTTIPDWYNRDTK